MSWKSYLDAQQRSEAQVETNLEEISSKAAPSFPYKIPKLSSDSQDASSTDTRETDSFDSDLSVARWP